MSYRSPYELPSISPATATRDLSFGLERGLLLRKGQYATTRYRFLA